MLSLKTHIFRTGVVLALILVAGFIVYSGVPVASALTRFTWDEMDWNSDGTTSIFEVIDGLDVGSRVALSGCNEYFRYKDGLPVRVWCPQFARTSVISCPSTEQFLAILRQPRSNFDSKGDQGLSHSRCFGSYALAKTIPLDRLDPLDVVLVHHPDGWKVVTYGTAQVCDDLPENVRIGLGC